MEPQKIISPTSRPKIYLGIIAAPIAVLICAALVAWLKTRMEDPVDILPFAQSIVVVGALGILVLIGICAYFRAHRGFIIILAGALLSGAITTYATFASWFGLSFF